MTEARLDAAATREGVLARDRDYYMNTFGARTPIVAAGGAGCDIIDVDGQRYLDLIGGIAVNVLGHGNAALTAAIADQAATLLHCSNLFYIPQQAELAERLCARTGMARAFFCNSGAEANEGAFKLARGYHAAQGRPRARVLSATMSFHGRTLATVTATGQPKYNQKFAPLPPGFEYIPFNDRAALEAALDDEVACVIVELIQGESGVHPVSRDYAEALRSLCDETGALLIVDEIQTGMGRTGAFTASELYGLRPDIISLAKGLGGGVPIGALLASERAAAGFEPGDHGTTFGGNPLACRAALAVLDEYEHLGLCARATEAGAALQAALAPLLAEGGPLLEVRGTGLMLGLELRDGGAATVRDRLRTEERILVNSIGDTTLRLLPPLVISDEEIQRAAAALGRVLRADG